ncbi:hypothetical protein Vse01_41840 [Micromonospora sediminimaris]|uniref:Uncharacterized protein n=1 Tax=Micromonospora sediminimaris TaxID=547162 RepID=A0A9W5UUZ3_9ACTN|nr:hypothetical protein Vse01_41840 [Micromonospora sediminimaris]
MVADQPSALQQSLGFGVQIVFGPEVRAHRLLEFRDGQPAAIRQEVVLGEVAKQPELRLSEAVFGMSSSGEGDGRLIGNAGPIGGRLTCKFGVGQLLLHRVYLRW